MYYNYYSYKIWRSNFFLALVNKIHRLNQYVWYLLETEDGKHGWIISKYVTL